MLEILSAGVAAAMRPTGDDGGLERVTAVRQVLDALPMPAFVLDTDHTVVGWSDGMETLLGIAPEDALGSDSRETIVVGGDDEQSLSFADKVLLAPRTAAEEYGVDRLDSPYTSYRVYERESRLRTASGSDVDIRFQVMPLFDGGPDGELMGVLEVIQDRTEELRRREALQSLVTEVTATLRSAATGALDARVEYECDAHLFEDGLLDVVGEVNRTLERFESLVANVEGHAADVSGAATTANDAAHHIDGRVTEQRLALETARDDLAAFSATMEKVAASSTEVEAGADRARVNVASSLDSTAETRSVTDEVKARSDELLETVHALEADMTEISEVVSLISEIAERTNILALNANIEAARAGEAGSGFAVVAGEVKSLANETQTHTEQVTERIERVQSRANETARLVETTHEDIGRADAAIDDTAESLREAADAVDEAVEGVSELSTASDDQAESVESVVVTVEDVSDDAAEIEEAIGDIVAVVESQHESADRLDAMLAELTR
ncbi:methyl-accepting chemotaxis protein [Halogeometricum luteum]|uniref:Methyl-accepting chemotaxis protein n=1 Tax=Halogeometricum luteum TaxID=2950537 RepID=A0ABU2G3M5_9EURY|nr:methyl-accepting chemotaxis protein [Halogeometricum sp. S3BR5-2]MDS0294834.1 methyl-accepting chemotaxis protein [Halogeometricum sp. S3BR5-2]